jgi:secreted trypsin-like serine protease
MVKNSRGRYELAGVTSLGEDVICGTSTLPGLYAKVSSVVNWIEETVKSLHVDK